MTNTVQIDRIMTDVNALGDNEKIVLFHKIEELLNNTEKTTSGEIPIDSVFGLWKDRDITIDKIRQKAWRQKQVF